MSPEYKLRDCPTDSVRIRSFLGRVQDLFLVLVLVPLVAGHAIRGFLANDAESGPRHRSQPLRADVLFAVEANPETARIDTVQRASDFAQAGRLPAERS